MALLVGAVLIINVLDAVLTAVWIGRGVAYEANIFLRDLAHTQPVLFITLKILIVSLGSFLLWRYRRNHLAVVGLGVVFLFYYFTLLYHFWYVGWLIRGARECIH